MHADSPLPREQCATLRSQRQIALAVRCAVILVLCSIVPLRPDPMADKTPTETPPLQPAFVCEIEASELLNCAASGSYNEARCLTLLKKFRKCVEKERVAKFTLVPNSEPATGADEVKEPAVATIATPSEGASSSGAGP